MSNTSIKLIYIIYDIKSAMSSVNSLFIIVERLRVGFESLPSEQYKILEGLVLPQYKDLVVDIIHYFDNKIVDPILKSSTEDIRVVFQNSVDVFALKLAELNAILILSYQHNITKLVDLDRVSYDIMQQAIKKTSLGITEDVAVRISTVTESLIDYENVLLGIVIKRPEHLVEAVKAIDANDLIRSLSGTVLALYCIFRFFGNKMHDPEKLSMLLQLAEEYSETVQSYADTIDITSNPDEMELLKRSEQE